MGYTGELGGLCDADAGARGESMPYQTEPLGAVIGEAIEAVTAYLAAGMRAPVGDELTWAKAVADAQKLP